MYGSHYYDTELLLATITITIMYLSLLLLLLQLATITTEHITVLSTNAITKLEWKKVTYPSGA